MAILCQHARGQVQRPEEDRLEIVLPADPSADVADGAPEIGLELAQSLAGPLELMSVGIALMPDEGRLAHSRIRLAQIDPDRFGK